MLFSHVVRNHAWCTHLLLQLVFSSSLRLRLASESMTEHSVKKIRKFTINFWCSAMIRKWVFVLFRFYTVFRLLKLHLWNENAVTLRVHCSMYIMGVFMGKHKNFILPRNYFLWKGVGLPYLLSITCIYSHILENGFNEWIVKFL